MKKIMSWILLVAMLLGMFAGCGKAEDPTQPATTPVETVAEAPAVTENSALDVINYLLAIYKDSGAKTGANFERFGIVRIAGVPYEVVWTASVGEDLVKIVVNEDGTVTIDVNEKCPEDTTYTLTATVTDANGNTESASWEYLLPGSASLEQMHAWIDEAYTLEKGASMTEEVTLYGVIKTIDTPYSEQYKNITVTIVVEGREDKPIMCYRLKGDGAESLNPGDTITVQGLIKNYNGTIEFDSGCVLVAVEKTGAAIEIPSDPHQIMNDVYALGNNESLPYGPVTLTGTICAIDTPYSEQYGNITVTISIDYYTIKCYRMSGDGVEDLEVNDIITVKGYIKKYNGTREFDKPELLNVVKVGAYEQPWEQIWVVKNAYELDPGWCSPYSPVHLLGTVTKVNSAWSDKYENITVTMVAYGDDKGEYPIECYRMTVPEDASDELKEAIKNLKVGDEILVNGVLMNYQSATTGKTKVEFNMPELLDVNPAPVVESNLTATLTTELKTGDKVVIAVPAHSKALSSNYNGFYNNGQDVTIDGNIIKGFNESEIWTVTKNSDGSYSFAFGGKKLSMGSSRTSTPLGDVNDKWNVNSLGNNLFNIVNKGRSGYALQFQTSYGTWSAYNYGAPTTDKQYQISFYKFEGELPEEGGSTSENVYMTSAPKNGDKVVIVAPAYNKALSSTATGNYNAGVSVTASGSTLSGYGDTEIWTVTVNDDGSYSFENGGQNIGMQASFTSMKMGAVNDDWTLTSLGNNLYNIKNAVRGTYMEWYSKYSNWSTYGASNAASDDQFQLSFYLVEAGSGSGSGDEGGSEESELTISDISAALAATTGTELKVKGVVTLLDGKNVYIQDSTGAICVRMSATPSDLALGDTIIATGSKADNYKGLPQITGTAYEKSSGLTLTAAEISLDDLEESMICTYVKITDLIVTEVNDYDGTSTTPNITVKSADETSMLIYKAVVGKTDGEWDIKVGDTVTVSAAVGIYNTTYQLRNTLASEIVVTKSASTEPEGGEGEGDEGGSETPSDPITKDATLSFADKAQRTTYNTSQQVWEQNGIVFTNDKAASTNNVADYANPVRLYASSKITVAMAGMTKIVFTCNSASYANVLKNSIGTISNGTVTVSGSTVTVEFNSAVDSFVVEKLTAQTRFNSLTVTYQEG